MQRQPGRKTDAPGQQRIAPQLRVVGPRGNADLQLVQLDAVVCGVGTAQDHAGQIDELFIVKGVHALLHFGGGRGADLRSGAALVVCRGETMAQALFNIQNNYPGVHYLLFDGEPHNSSYTNYTTESNVHCVLFQEEQAGFLAGYAAVTDGYTQLGFIGAEEIPGVVRYVTGFLQGAEYAAEQQGLTVDLRTWFAGTYSASDDTTNRMLDWCNNGTTLLFVNGGNLIASAIDAAKETTSGNEVRVMASDYDQNDSSDLILGSAIKCYNSAVQQELYAFFSGNAAWDQTVAGQSEKVGYTTGAVALAGPHWRFAELSQHDYERLYTQLRNSDLKVDTYADMNTLPDTPNVTVEEQN